MTARDLIEIAVALIVGGVLALLLAHMADTRGGPL